MDERLLLKIDEAAALISVGKVKFYQLIKAGEIQSIKIGRSRRIPLDALRRWVERKVAESDETGQ